jgi:hypothetical protein
MVAMLNEILGQFDPSKPAPVRAGALLALMTSHPSVSPTASATAQPIRNG